MQHPGRSLYVRAVNATHLALAGALLAATPVVADDRCLSGASLLTDQRDLVALDAANEVACPCATFTGGPGLTRGAYQRCVRGPLRDALDAGTLRVECRSTARGITRGSTCGTTKVACGRFQPSSATPVSCRVKDASRCADRHGYEERACAAETRCADVVDWTAGTCTDTRQLGPFGAGARTITFTKPSAVNPAVTRTLNTAIWYPAVTDGLPTDPNFHAAKNAPLDASGGPYPILMFSHGSCGYPLQSTFMTPLIASYGFIVVAPPHPGNTITDYPTCGTPAAQLASATERPEDIIYVLDQMLQENQNPSSPFFGAIDAARIGMSGHSFGGYTTYVVADRDARIVVALPMAPAVLGTPPLTMPSLTMFGDIDAVVDTPSIVDAYDAGTPPKYLVQIHNTGHYAFSNLCFASPDCDPPATLTQAEAHDDVLRWIVPFLKVYLAGDASFRPFLAGPGGPAFDFQAAL